MILSETQTQLLSVLYIIGPCTDGELGYAVMKQSKEFNRIRLEDMLKRLENKGFEQGFYEKYNQSESILCKLLTRLHSYYENMERGMKSDKIIITKNVSFTEDNE